MKQKTSISFQISACKEYAKRQGWTIHQIFNEGEKSARSSELEEREMISKLMNEVKSGFIERIIVFKRDRISRRVDQYMEFIELLKNHNVTMHLAGDNEPQMFDGVVGDFIELLFGAISEYEGNNITQRLIQSRIAKVREGEWGGGRPPTFFYMEEIKKKGINGKDEEEGEIQKKLMIKDEDKEKIKKIYEFVKNGNFESVAEANQALKKSGIISKKNLDLSEFIPKELHKGWMTASFEGVHIKARKVNKRLKAVEADLWDAANEKLKQLNDFYIEKESVSINPKLEGILFCGHCSAALIVKRGHYLCPTNSSALKIKVETLDNEVLKEIQVRMTTHVAENKNEIISYFTKKLTHPLEEKVKKIEFHLQKAQKELQEITLKCISKPITEGERQKILQPFVNDYKKWYEEYKITKYKLAINREKLTFALRKMLPVPTIQSLSNYKQKELIRFFIKRIKLNTDKGNIIEFRRDMSKEESNCHKSQ
jgi:DNA invertase Pin-like site-specific DNA recombinase